jgi:hypothetical protein
VQHQIAAAVAVAVVRAATEAQFRGNYLAEIHQPKLFLVLLLEQHTP